MASRRRPAVRGTIAARSSRSRSPVMSTEARGSAAFEHHVILWVTTDDHRPRRDYDSRLGNKCRDPTDERLSLVCAHLSRRSQLLRDLTVLRQEVWRDVASRCAQHCLHSLRRYAAEGIGRDENAGVNDDSGSSCCASRVASSVPFGRLPRRPRSSTSRRGTPHEQHATPHRGDPPATAQRGCTPLGRSSVPKPSCLDRTRSHR
jgi:hypothetical protein